MLSFTSAYSDSLYIEDYDISIEYDSAIADDIFTLKVSISNDAGSAKNLTLEFDPEKPFDFITDEEWNLYLGSGETTSKTFRVEIDEDAEKKTYDLEFNLDDGNDDWDDSFDIKVLSDSADISIGEIVSSPAKICPGTKDVKLEVNIRNKGDKDAEDLVTKIILPQGFEPSSAYSDIVYSGDLNAGETQILTFYFDIEETLLEDNYVTSLNLNYVVEGDDKESALDLQIPIFGIPQFEISDGKVIEQIIQGKDAKIKLALTNIGSKDAQDVTLKVYERSDQPFDFVEKSVYIGSLKSGEIGYAIFEFKVENDAEPINYLLDFQIRSISGETVIVDDLTTKILVQQKELNFSSYLIYLILGSFVLLVIILVFIIKKGKNGI